MRQGILKEALDRMLPQLLIAMIKLHGKNGEYRIPVATVDDTSQDLLSFGVSDDQKEFIFTLSKKS